MTSSLEQSVCLAIDDTQCIGCGICADVCLTGALVMGLSDLRPVWRAEPCSACGDCVCECPTTAIRLNTELTA